MDVRSFTSHLEIVRYKMDENKAIRGYQTQVARSIGMHSSQFSLMLRGDTLLTLDQGAALCRLWEFPFLLSEYFITLLMIERGGSSVLVQHLRQKLAELRQSLPPSYVLPSSENEDRRTISGDDEVFFWRSWHCPAIQACLAAFGPCTAEVIGDRLNLSLESASAILERMGKMGIALQQADGLWAIDDRCYVKHATTNLVEPFNISLRQKSGEMSQSTEGEPIRLSVIGVVSPEDEAQIRKMVMDTIHQQVAVLRKPTSGQETRMISLCGLFSLLTQGFGIMSQKGPQKEGPFDPLE